MAVGNTVYGKLAGSVADSFLKDLSVEDKQFVWAEALAKGDVTGGVSSRFVGLTHPLNAVGDVNKEINVDYNTQRWINTTRLDGRIRMMKEGAPITPSDIIREVVVPLKDQAEQKRLLERMEFALETRNMKHYSFWMSMQAIETPEARAAAFFREMNRVSPEHQASMRSEMGRVKSLFESKQFWSEYGRLVTEKKGSSVK